MGFGGRRSRVALASRHRARRGGSTASAARPRRPRSSLELAFEQQLSAARELATARQAGKPDLQPFETEHYFARPRRWRFDFAFPAAKLAVEIEGAVWSRGRHTRGSGFIADCDKYNRATLLGWSVLRFTDNHIRSGAAIAAVLEFFSRC